MIQRPRGTADILPAEAAKYRYIEQKAREIAALYGFSEIRFPTFESTELFFRGVGDGTDIVQKEMYTFADKEGRSLTLRPEGTASLARAVVENGLYGGNMPLKYYYVINCFRYEVPQSGRSREFTQFGMELYGAPLPAADVSVISAAYRIAEALRIKATVNLNSIGCRNCRPVYLAKLREYYEARRDRLCDTCRERLGVNAMRLLDCKEPECRALAAEAPKISDCLCDECKAHFSATVRGLERAGIRYRIDPNTVRGLDYYTKTVFELIADDGSGAAAVLGGGGRYDGMIGELGGPELGGIGFAVGLSRLALAMPDGEAKEEKPALYVAPMGERAAEEAAVICEKLRSLGIACETDLVGRSLKAQMKYADKSGFGYTAVIGDSELDSGKCVLRSMADGCETETAISDIPDTLVKLLAAE